jgi:hypothetical protein
MHPSILTDASVGVTWYYLSNKISGEIVWNESPASAMSCAQKATTQWLLAQTDNRAVQNKNP